MNREQRKYIADKLKDVCMLGDADELLEKLASFEKKEF